MYKVCCLAFVVAVMTAIALRENYDYIQKIYKEQVDPRVWQRVDIVPESELDKMAEDELGSMGLWETIMMLLLSVTSMIMCWTFNDFRRKSAKESFQQKLDNIEQRYGQRLDSLEDEITDLKKELNDSCCKMEKLYAQEEIVLKEILTHDFCNQMDSQGLGIDQYSQTACLHTKDSTQQTTGKTMAESEDKSPQGVPVAVPGMGDPRLRNEESWYEEVKKEEESLAVRQDGCNIDTMHEANNFMNDDFSLQMEVPQSPVIQDGINYIDSKLDTRFDEDSPKGNGEESDLQSAELSNSPRQGKVENVSVINKSNQLRQIPQYQGPKKDTQKQYHSTHKNILDENDSPRITMLKHSDIPNEAVRNSRPSTPRPYSSPEGVELKQGVPNRRRKGRNNNVK